MYGAVFIGGTVFIAYPSMLSIRAIVSGFSSLGNTFPCPCWRGSVWLSLRCPCWALVSVVLRDPLRVVVICGAVSAAVVSCRWCRRLAMVPTFPACAVCLLSAVPLRVRCAWWCIYPALGDGRKWQTIRSVSPASAGASAPSLAPLRVRLGRSGCTPRGIVVYAFQPNNPSKSRQEISFVYRYTYTYHIYEQLHVIMFRVIRFSSCGGENGGL